MFDITEKPIDVEAVRQKVVSRNAGAITLFIGTVRELTNGKKTLHLEYQAYPAMAVKMFEQIAKEVHERLPEAKVAITHRVGHLAISDIAVVIAVSSPHHQKWLIRQMNMSLIVLSKLYRFGKRNFGRMVVNGLAIN